MSISLSKSESGNLLVKILRTPKWGEDLACIKDIYGRKWIGESKLWEIPWYAIADLKSSFKDIEIIYSDPWIKDLFNRYEKAQLSVHDLERIEVPKFLVDLRPHQTKYVGFSRDKSSTLLTVNTGGGKAIASLARSVALGATKVLIICPKSVLKNFRANLWKLTKDPTVLYQGGKTQRIKLLENIKEIQKKPNYFVMCTPQTLAEITSNLKSGVINKFDHVIIDEAHLFSKGSKKFDILDELLNFLDWVPRQPCTGTPIQHSPRDLWAPLHLTDPFLVGTLGFFEKKYLQPIKYFRQIIEVKDKYGNKVIGEDGKPEVTIRMRPTKWKFRNNVAIKELLDKVSFRVRREDITDFKDQVDIVTVDLTPSQRDQYKLVKNAILNEMAEGKLHIKNVPTRMLRLLQAAEGMFNFDKNNHNSGKLDYISEILDETEDKIIVWSRFKPITHLLYEKYKDKAVIYNGDMSDGYKSLAKWAFNGCDTPEDEKEYELLAKRLKFTLKPGEAQFFFSVIDMQSSIGMDLQRYCSRQIFSSYSWLGSANAQAAARIIRIGQEADLVSTIFLVSENTLEAKALESILKGFRANQAIIDGDESLGVEQLDELINLLKEVD